MWTYQKPIPKPMPEACRTPRAKQRTPVLAFLAAGYFAGGLLGALSPDNTFLHYYAGYFSELLSASDRRLTFSLGFFPQVLQCTLVLLAGLCAAGVLLLPLLFFIKGFAFGFLAAALYAQAGLQGMLALWVVFWLPEALCLLLLLLLGWKAWSLSLQLAKGCFARSTGIYRPLTKALLDCYLLAALGSLLSSGAQGMLCTLLTGLLSR